jgi:hypothetical protein
MIATADWPRMSASAQSKVSEAKSTDRAWTPRPQSSERAVIALGPLFTAGVALLLYGIFRRRAVALAAGLVAVWLDQRSELGQSLKERVRAGTNTMVFEKKSSEQTSPGSEISA